MNDKLWYAIGLDLTPLKKQVREAQDEFRKIDKVAYSEGQKIDKTFQGIGASLKSLVPVASFATAGLMLKQLATDSYRFERSFSMAMREVQTISQAVEKDFKGISDELMNLAANGPDNAIQLAQAYYQIVSAGHDGAKGLEILRVSSEAATAGLTETKIAADGITTVLNAWGKDASEAANIADVMFKTVEKGKTTFPELASNIAQVAPLAASMNITFEEVAASVASLTKQGVNTPMAFTQIRQAILSVNDVLGDGWQKSMTFQEALQKVRDMAGGSDTKLKEMMGRVEGMSAVLALTGEKAREAAGDLEAMTTATGAMKTAYDKMMKEADNQWSMVHNKWQRELKGLGEAIATGSINIAKVLNELLTDREEDIIKPEVKQAISGFTAELDSLADREGKLKLITDRIIEIRNATRELRTEETELAKQQPGGLQKGVEAFNRGIGLGPAYSPGLIKEKELEIIQEDIDINERVLQELSKLYQQVLSGDDAETVIQQGKKQNEASIKTIRDALKNIQELREKLGSGSIQQDVEIYLKIADEQRFIDDFSQKVRERLKTVLNDNVEIKPISPKSTTGLISKEVTKEAKEQLKPMKVLTEEERKRLEVQSEQLDNLHDQQALYEEISKGFTGAAEIIGALSFAVGELDMELGRTIGKIADLAGNTGKFITQVSSGDYVGAVTSGISAFGNIISLLKNDNSDEALALGIERVNESISRTNQLLDYQLNLLANTEGADWFVSATKQIGVLNRELNSTINNLNAIEVRRKGSAREGVVDTSEWDIEQWFSAMKTGAFTFGGQDESVNDYLNQWIDIEAQIQKIKEEQIYRKFGFDSGSVAETIADGIISGLQTSEDGLGDWTENFGKLMESTLKRHILNSIVDTKILDPFMQELDKAMEDNKITDEELNFLEDLFSTLADAGQEAATSLKPIIDRYLTDEAEGPKGLTGAIQGITEETGSLIAGQFTAMRIDIKSTNELIRNQFEIMDQSLGVLNNIEKNTRGISRLENIQAGIDETNKILKQGLF